MNMIKKLYFLLVFWERDDSLIYGLLENKYYLQILLQKNICKIYL